MALVEDVGSVDQQQAQLESSLPRRASGGACSEAHGSGGAMSNNSDLLVANTEEHQEFKPLRFRDLDGGGLEEITSPSEADSEASTPDVGTNRCVPRTLSGGSGSCCGGDTG
jgi:hypothetical protein